MDNKKIPAKPSSRHVVSRDPQSSMDPGLRISGATTPATPLMRQYFEIKARYPNEILFFRLGDFYEMFNEDAQKAAPILEVALTHRQDAPMCGVPAHSVDPYIAKLLRVGLRVAIAEQMEEPSAGKGIVRRDVIRVITPGTVQEDTLLSAKQSNYLVALAIDGTQAGLAAIECSTGEFLTTQIEGGVASSKLWDEMTRLAPSEVIVAARADSDTLKTTLQKRGLAWAELPAADFAPALAEERLKTLFGTASLRGFGLEGKTLALSASGAALRYLENTQCGKPLSLRPLRTYSLDDYLLIDAHTLDHLDLLSQDRKTQNTPTLLGVLDQTVTPMGGRLIRRWLLAPLKEVAAIQERQRKVEFFLEGKEWRRSVRAVLSGWPDVERILARLTARTASPRDLSSLGQGLRRIQKLKTHLASAHQQATALGAELPGPLKKMLLEFPEEQTLADLLESAVEDAPPATLKEGGVIRAGYHSELDEVRRWITEGKDRLLELEKREREATGINSLKVSFNSVFGYYLEVTKANLSRVPAHYVRKQTTANGERYITQELKEFETKILGAEERAVRLETTLVQQLSEEVFKKASALQHVSQSVAELDVILSLAEVAERNRYVKPTIESSDLLVIREGRHPVLEQVLPSGTLVPNDIDLKGRDRHVVILTGPNMSGKSTYLRQTALIVILAQMGSYVPAAEARIGVIDHLFTRIGASDRLAEGESTFMVEMVETAHILHHATPRSLVILDEVGRGTSTYDGISIAWSCLEYLHALGPKVLFATHYFELTQLADKLSGVTNAHVTAREWGDSVIFLHKVEPGPADRSFGIHVARLAGVPKAVVERAEVLLKTLEETAYNNKPGAGQKELPLFTTPPVPRKELPAEWIALRKELEALAVESTTPVDALLKLQQWKQRFLKGDSPS